MCSGSAQSVEGDFGRAVEAEGNAYGAEAAIDVEPNVAEAVLACGEEPAAGRKNDRADERETNLTAVGVAAKHEADSLASGQCAHVAAEIGGVAEENDGLLRNISYGSGDGEVGDRVAGDGIVEAGEPDAGFAALERDIAVAQQGDAIIAERGADLLCVDVDVVVAEHAVDAAAMEALENVGALPRSADGEFVRTELAGDVVAGDEDEIGIELVYVTDDVAKEKGLSELIEVDIAEVRDLDPFKVRRQAGNDSLVAGDFEPVALDFAGIDGKAECAQCTHLQEPAAAESARSGRRGYGDHVPMVNRRLQTRMGAGFRLSLNGQEATPRG